MEIPKNGGNDIMCGLCNTWMPASQVSHVIMMHHNFLIDQVCMHADHQLLEITSSHFQVRITQNANEDMLMTVLIV